MKDRPLTLELRKAIALPAERNQRGARAAAVIRRFGAYRWVGLYDVGDNEIAILGWDGPSAPAHPRFPRGKGLCGSAVASAKPVIAGDVRTDPRYLTTHTSTRSEMVIPVISGDSVVGLIDVESERPSAFDQRDKELLEGCAAVLLPLWETSRAG
jgi:L-methionine (R)-S-oxide reductase